MFDSPATLAKMIDGINEKVIENVSFKILMLIQEYITRDVYKSGDPGGSAWNTVYYDETHKPTLEFLLAFQRDDIKKIVHGIARKIWYNFESMRYDKNTYLHGDPDLGDLREDLADILNVSGYDQMNYWGGKMRQPYWDNIIEELFKNEMIGTWFNEEFSKFGIVNTI